MKKFAFMLFLLSTAGNGFAQNCESILLGQVVDFHDNTPLEGATILITGTPLTTITKSDGKFRFEGICDGVLELEIFHPDCKSQFITITMKGDTFKKVSLEHHLEELQEVKVVGDLVKKETNSASEQTLNLNTIERFSGKSIGDALREIAGVSSLNTGSNIVKPSIHGLNGSRVLILNDGVRMQDMEWGEEHAPNMDINGSGSISVIKGAAALQYGGDAIGGVIVVSPQKIIKKDSLFGKSLLNAMTNGRGGNISSELSKTYESGWFANGQASFKRLGDREAPDYVLSNTGVKEIGIKLNVGKQLFDWGWKANYSFFDAELAILRASHIGNVDDLIRSINGGQPEVIDPFTYDIDAPRQEVTHHIASLNVYKRFQGLGKWNVQYDFQNNRRFEYDIRVGDDRNTAAIDLELTTHTFATDFKWDASSKRTLTMGLLARFQNNFANPATGVRRLIPDYEKFDFGGFLIADFYLNENFTLDAGVRYDFNRVDAQKFYLESRWVERGYETEFESLIVDDLGTQLLTNPKFDYHNFSGTVGFQYEPNNSSNFRLNYALAQRAPNPSELFSDGLHHSAARIELGDLRISSETSHKVSLSQSKDFDSWGYSVEPYVNFISDFILLEPTGVEFTIRGAFPVWTYRQTDTRLIGVDFTAYTEFHTNWKTNHSFSLVKGKDISKDQALIQIPPVSFGNTLTYMKPEWNGFEIRLESRYAFRQNEFPPNITIFSPGLQEEVLLEINTPPEAYHLLNLDAQMAFSVFGNGKLTTSVSAENLLNTNYRNYLNRQRYFADDLGRNISLQLKLNY
ncbi:TonB-dependent receptor [Maribacter algarum]|uniref:TonB-dependent receptor n=1 Tax=Maribacter algarum (ex Zhang et al. 2020) TaxID=2578118 RepID=A0A5S3PRU4_9FLAO|nr:TonB-dependent receptor [Maribacter algarum]TMM57476.1 TonB-dependent receptor [Maribacter algarum]